MELLDAFEKAREYVTKNYPKEIDWSHEMVEKDPSMVEKKEFTREYVWCIYTSGFSVKVIRKYWPKIQRAYFDFDPNEISEREWIVRRRALELIGNNRKTDTILKGVGFIILYTPLDWFKFMIEVDKNIDILMRLPGIGDVLKYHLARNIGVDTIKPDIHLQRMAHHFGMDSFKMCRKIRDRSRQPLHVIDTILWRASVDRILDFRPG